MRLTPETELNILFSCPDVDENDTFRGPGPTSIVSLLGETTVDTVLLYPGQIVRKLCKSTSENDQILTD